LYYFIIVGAPVCINIVETILLLDLPKLVLIIIGPGGPDGRVHNLYHFVHAQELIS
jgi:hypothetical protein